MAKHTSRLRQRLAQLGELHQRQIGLLLQEQGPLIRGSFGSRARLCGEPNCRCTRGERHESKYLAASDAGRMRQVHVPVSDEVQVKDGAERYRGFREARSRLAEVAKEELAVVDQLGDSLRKPYPPDDPLPPPRRRGRTPKGGRRVGR